MNTSSGKIWIDLDIWDCQIRAYRPEDQNNPIPNDDIGKMIFYHNAPQDRLNKRTFGTLKGNALRKARRIVDMHGSISTSGIYGSIEIDERDFIPWEKEE